MDREVRALHESGVTLQVYTVRIITGAMPPIPIMLQMGNSEIFLHLERSHRGLQFFGNANRRLQC